MKKQILFTIASTIFTVAASSAFAAEGDLTLPGERWYAEFDKYTCNAFQPAVAVPAEFAAMNVQFTRLTSDRSLDNVLVKGTFEQDGAQCSYSMILFADNDASTYKLVESRAVGANCEVGKKVLDAAFTGEKYLYYGHPHNIALMLPLPSAQATCGADLVGANFIVKGKVPGQ